MSLLESWENALLDKYLEAMECRGICSPCDQGDCCGDECLDRDDDRDYEREAEDRAERRMARMEGDW